MIPEGVDVFGRRALVTAAPFVEINGDPYALSVGGLEIGSEVAIVGEDTGRLLRVVARGYEGAVTVHGDCLTLAVLTPTPAVPVGPEVAAHVLWHFRQLGYPPGSFIADLIRAIAAADPGNRRRIARGFPDYTRAVRLATEDPDGIDQLRRVMQTRVPLE